MSILSYALFIAATGLFALNGCREIFHENAVRLYSDKKARKVFKGAIACMIPAIILFPIATSANYQLDSPHTVEGRWITACILFMASYIVAYYSLFIADLVGRIIGFLIIDNIYQFKTKTAWRDWMSWRWY